jgi:uncharacterized membrane protein YphA (DoxX/SURF4 family)
MRATINSEVQDSSYILLISRVLLSAIFVWSGIGKILDPTSTQQYMAAHGMPATGFIGTIGLSIAFGCSSFGFIFDSGYANFSY